MILYYAAAITVDDATSPEGAIPPGCRSLTFDSDLNRFVLQLHEDFSTPDPSWESKTEAEVEVDYPGLIGGA